EHRGDQHGRQRTAGHQIVGTVAAHPACRHHAGHGENEQEHGNAGEDHRNSNGERGVPAPLPETGDRRVSLLLLLVKDRRGQRTFESVITGLLAVIAVGFLASLFVSAPPVAEVAGGLVPKFAGTESVLIAAAMLGATVMPHAVYLHSGLARDRHGHPEPGPTRRMLLRITRWDVGVAMVIAGAVNLSMVLVAATNLQGRENTDSIEGAHAAVADTLGPTV